MLAVGLDSGVGLFAIAALASRWSFVLEVMLWLMSVILVNVSVLRACKCLPVTVLYR